MKKNRKGENNPNYRTGITLQKNYCIDCEKIISWNAIRCHKCEHIRRNIEDIGCVKGKEHRWYGLKGKLSPAFGRIPKHPKRQVYKEICFRSSWEVAYAKYLDFNNIKWLYESKTFDLGNTTYTPDFYLPESDLFIEIKGWWSDKFDIKIKLFTELYSNINLIIYEEGVLNLLGILDESYLLTPSLSISM